MRYGNNSRNSIDNGGLAPAIRLTLADFMRWPLDMRKRFVDLNMNESPDFIKSPLLRPAMQ